MTDKGRALRAIGLFGFLVAVYFSSYTGAPLSTDELLMADGAHSLIHGHNLELAYTNSYRLYSRLPEPQLFLQLDTEPMQSFAVAPLVWLGEHMPGIGVMQTGWLFNILITALTAVLIFYYGTLLGYRDNVALAVALIFGLATYAWPYSKMLFREPLFTLFILTCTYSLERWRQQLERQRFRVGWLLLAALALAGGLLTKSASLLVAPLLVMVTIPAAMGRLLNWRVLVGLVLLGALFVIGLLLYQQVFSNSSAIFRRLIYINWESTAQALAAFLLSPGFSLWAFSPILLAGLAGFHMLLRNRRIRQALVPLIVFLSLVGSYSLFQSDNWYGGTGWGPRYLLPTIPYLALWLLPVVAALFERKVAAWQQATLIGLAANSVFVQVLGLLVPPEQFTTYLYAEGDAFKQFILPWREGVWSFLYNTILVTAHEVTAPSPIAWIVNGTGAIIIPLCILTALIGVVVFTRRTCSWRGLAAGALVVSISISAMIFIGLRSYYHDPRWIGGDPALFRTLDNLNHELRPGDAVILNDAFYQRFFMNYYKQSAPIYVLPDAPGERLGGAAQPEVLTSNPQQQAHPYDSLFFPRLAEQSSRWWFITEFGPYSPGRLRPTEHYLVRHYFPAREIGQEQNVRLVLFVPINAPPDMIPPWPQQPVGADYGPAYLVGYDLTRGAVAKPGAPLVVSLLWRHDGWPADIPKVDYSVNVSLVNSQGAVVAQRAYPPLSTFAPMTQWTIGGYYRDNHALELPADLPSGDYQLWVLLYDGNTRLPIRNAASSTPHDHAIITTIHVK